MLNCHPMVSFGEPLGHVKTVRGQILVSRTDDDFLFSFFFTLFFAVCGALEEGGRVCLRSKRPPCVDSKTSPCMPATRAHVETHVRVVPACTGRFESTHGDFSASHGTHHDHTTATATATATTTHTTTTTTTTTTTHNDKLTNLRLNPVQHEKTHHVKTRQ